MSFDLAATLRAYADAINDLALRVTELEGQVIAFTEAFVAAGDDTTPDDVVHLVHEQHSDTDRIGD